MSVSCCDGELSKVIRWEVSCSVSSQKAYRPRPSPSSWPSSGLDKAEVQGRRRTTLGQFTIRSEKDNLPSILRSKSVTKTVPTYFKEKEPPIISYTYTKTIASKIFNFSSTLLDLDYHQFHNNPSPCECNTSSHVYEPYGHVITGELSIIPNSKLGDLIAKGPKYRERCSSIILEGNGKRPNWRTYFQAKTEFQTTHW